MSIRLEWPTTVNLDNSNEFHSESCLVCLDNMGQISIYTLPALRRQILFNCIKPTDITALSSFQFTPYAHAFYLQSSPELCEVSFSPQMNFPYSMMISYDKLQRKTILRSVEEKSIKQANTVEIPSKDSISSLTPTSQNFEVGYFILTHLCWCLYGNFSRVIKLNLKNLYPSQQ